MILNRMAGGWRELPDNIFCDIMTMVGLKLKGLKDLHYSRLVCHDWNAKISQMTKQHKSIIKDCVSIYGVLGHPCVRHFRICHCISVVAEATHKTWLKALEGCRVSSKKPFKGSRQRQGSCWEERKRKKCFPMRGH